MEARTAGVVAGAMVAGLLLAWNTWTMERLSRRVVGLEAGVARLTVVTAERAKPLAPLVPPASAKAQRAAERASAAEAGGSPGGPSATGGQPATGSARAGRGGGGAPLDRDQRFERVASQWLSKLELEVEDFAIAEGLSHEETDEIMAELDELYLTLGAVREDVKEGGLSMADAKAELRILKEDADSRLKRLLGPDCHAALQGHIRKR